MSKANSRTKIIKRSCAVCGKRITVRVYLNKAYEGGDYFGKISIDKKKVEYWEYYKCFKNG